MKPTFVSISYAHTQACNVLADVQIAQVKLAQARTAMECSSPQKCAQLLTEAREQLIQLRRSQVAILRNIDAAVKSLA